MQMNHYLIHQKQGCVYARRLHTMQLHTPVLMEWTVARQYQIQPVWLYHRTCKADLYKDSSTQHNFTIINLCSHLSYNHNQSLHQLPPWWNFSSQPSWSLCLWHFLRKRRQMKQRQIVHLSAPWYMTQDVEKMHKGKSSCSRIPVNWKWQITATTVDIKRYPSQNAGYDALFYY